MLIAGEADRDHSDDGPRRRDARTGELQQAAFRKRLIQTAYWLDASMVAYPDAAPNAASNRPVAGAAPQQAEERSPLAQEVWRSTLAWKRVPRLSAPAADLEKTPM